MKVFISNIVLILILLMFSNRINAQNFNNYRDAEAVILKENGNIYSEKELEGAIIALPDNSNQLIVRLRIPYLSINENDEDDGLSYLPDYHFNLRVNIDSWKILESLTSGKTFETDGYLTLNHITRLVPVEYTPLPSLTIQNGGFNLNLILSFSPADFNLDVRGINTRYIIRIGDAPVNRL